jgi:ATP-dependent helicase/nuclease subunit A
MSAQDAGTSIEVLSPEQRAPLLVKAASVALRSGAGCGKTTVLTARFLTALDDRKGSDENERSPLASIVALTFTEKAARELRGRIRGECRKRLANSRDDSEVAFWCAVQRGLAAAPIGTFHEFCADLLRRHAVRAGLDPRFTVLDETIAASVLDESLGRSLRGWLANTDADLIETAVEFGLRSVREFLGTLVKERGAGDLLDWKHRTADELVALWRAAWEAGGREAVMAPLLRECGDCTGWLLDQRFDHPKLANFRVDLLERLAQVQPSSTDMWLGDLRESAKLPKGVKTLDWPSPAVNERAKKVLGSLRDAIDRFLDASQIDDETSTRAAAQGLRLARLATEARQAYEQDKAELGGLDFDDLLVKTRDLLRAEPSIVQAGAGGREIAFVLVDEFQDTDPVQSEILRLLCGERLARGGLFIVGDFKQSIYGFRGAAPALFNEYREAFPTAGRLDLKQNFRSSQSVLDFINALFDKTFSEDDPPLDPGPHAAPAHDGSAVDFVWAEEPVSEEPDRPKPRVSASQRREVEAQWLARLIRSRLNAGWPVRDRSTHEVRNARPGDVAFLFRAMTDLAPYEQALAAEGLDFYVVGGKAFFAQQEVQDLVNVLSVVEDPLDQVALAGALRGPFFGLSDDGLFWLGTSGELSLADGLRDCENVPGLNTLDIHRAKRARTLLGTWRALKDRVPIAVLADRVLDESGFEPALLGERLGDRKRANARKLVRLARRFDARGGFTLGHFVTRLRADIRTPPREDQAVSSEEEGQRVVRLMSIHQAKGLEFPIVVVPDLNRGRDSGRSSVALHPTLGPLVRPGEVGPGLDALEDDEAAGGSGRSLGWTIYQAFERLEEEAEALRLFYVAVTRARDALILSAGCGADEKPASPSLRLLTTRFHRGTGELLFPLEAGRRKPVVRVTTTAPSAATGKEKRKRRPRLRAVARAIESAPLSPPEPVPEPPRPRFVDLDSARSLLPRARRFDRLARAILADPRALPCRDLPLEELAALVARRQNPAATRELVSEVVDGLRPWLGGPLAKALRNASDVKRGFEFTLAWPLVANGQGPGDGTVFQGRAEWLVRDASGSWTVVTFCPQNSPESIERLRLLLSVRAAGALGFAPVVAGWRLVSGSDEIEIEEDFASPTIDAAVAEVLAFLRF